MTDHKDVDLGDLRSRYAQLLDARTPFSAFMHALPAGHAVDIFPADLDLERTGASELGRMRAQLPSLYDHSIKVAALAVGLARAIGLGESEQRVLAVAGLLHDVGEVRIDPAIVGASRPPTAEEWRQILAHPVLGKVLLETGGEQRAEVLRAIAEHHERIDGSGYPGGKHHDELGLCGQVLAVAELAGGITERQGLDYLEVVLKTQSRRLHGGVVIQALDAVARGVEATMEILALSTAAAAVQFAGVLAPLLEDWRALRLSGDTRDRAGWRQLDAAITDISRATRSAGVHVDPEGVRSFLEAVPEAEAEVAGLLRESLYQLRLAARARSAQTLPAELEFNTEDATALRTWLESVELRASPLLMAPAPVVADEAPDEPAPDEPAPASVRV